MQVGEASSGDVDRALHLFHARGWKEEGVLSTGGLGSISLVRGGPGGAKRSVLKRTIASEVKALQALAQCRNILTLEEYFFCDDACSEAWVKLEWLRGGDLGTYLRRPNAGLLPQETVQQILYEVLTGLRDMHLKGWMHRDVKEDNVGLLSPLVPGSRDCRVKLLDFKHAAEVPVNGRLTAAVGSQGYMAPEVLEASYDDLADCWSFGVLAHRLLLGTAPFEDLVQDPQSMVNWRQYLQLPPSMPEMAARFVRGLLVERGARMSSVEAARHPWFSEGFPSEAQRSTGQDLDVPKTRRASLANVPSPARSRKSGGFSPTHISECSQRSRRPSGRVRTRVEELERAASLAGAPSRAADQSTGGVSWACWSPPPTPDTSPAHMQPELCSNCARSADELQQLEEAFHLQREQYELAAEEAKHEIASLRREIVEMSVPDGRFLVEETVPEEPSTRVEADSEARLQLQELFRERDELLHRLAQEPNVEDQVLQRELEETRRELEETRKQLVEALEDGRAACESHDSQRVELQRQLVEALQAGRADREALESERADLQQQLLEAVQAAQADREALASERAELQRQVAEVEFLRNRGMLLDEEVRMLRERTVEGEAAQAQVRVLEAEKDILQDRVMRVEEVLERSLLPMQESSTLWQHFAKSMKPPPFQEKERKAQMPVKDDDLDLSTMSKQSETKKLRLLNAASSEALLQALEHERSALEKRVAEAYEAKDMMCCTLGPEEQVKLDQGSFVWEPTRSDLGKKIAQVAEEVSPSVPRTSLEATKQPTETGRSAPATAQLSPPRKASPLMEVRSASTLASISRPTSPNSAYRSPRTSPAGSMVFEQPAAGQASQPPLAAPCAPFPVSSTRSSPVQRTRPVRWTSPGPGENASSPRLQPPPRTGMLQSPRQHFVGGTAVVSTLRPRPTPTANARLAGAPGSPQTFVRSPSSLLRR